MNSVVQIRSKCRQGGRGLNALKILRTSYLEVPSPRSGQLHKGKQSGYPMTHFRSSSRGRAKASEKNRKSVNGDSRRGGRPLGNANAHASVRRRARMLQVRVMRLPLGLVEERWKFRRRLQMMATLCSIHEAMKEERKMRRRPKCQGGETEIRDRFAVDVVINIISKYIL